MKICSCGYMNPDENRFCTICGKNLEENTQQQQNNVTQNDFVNNANANGNNANPKAYDNNNGYNQNNGNYNNGFNAGYNPNAQNTGYNPDAQATGYTAGNQNMGYNPNGYNPNAQNTGYNPNAMGYNPNGYNSNGYNPNAYGAANSGYNPQGNRAYGYGSSPFAQQPMVSPAVRQFKEGLANVFASTFTLITGILMTVAAGISLISKGGLVMNLILIIGISLLVLNSKAKKSFPNLRGVFTAIKTYNVLNIILVSLVILAILIAFLAFASVPWDEVANALKKEASADFTPETLQTVLDSLLVITLSILPFMVAVLVNCIVGLKAMENLKTSYDAGYRTTKKLTAYAVTCFIVAITVIVYCAVMTYCLADMMDAMIKLAEAMDSYSGEIPNVSSVTSNGLLFVSVCYAVAFMFYGIWLLKIRSFNNHFVVRKEEATDGNSVNNSFDARGAYSINTPYGVNTSSAQTENTAPSQTVAQDNNSADNGENSQA